MIMGDLALLRRDKNCYFNVMVNCHLLLQHRAWLRRGYWRYRNVID